MRDHIAVSASLSLCCNSAWPLKKNNKFAYLGVKYDYWISIFFNSAPTFSGAQSPETDRLAPRSHCNGDWIMSHAIYKNGNRAIHWLTDWLTVWFTSKCQRMGSARAREWMCRWSNSNAMERIGIYCSEGISFPLQLYWISHSKAPIHCRL